MDEWVGQHGDDAFGTVGAVTRRLADELEQVIESRRPCGGAVAARSRAVRGLVVLAPVAAFGLVANAPVVAAGVAARLVDDEMWHASIKGVGGTALLPLTWGTELVFLTRRYGLRRALALTAAGAISGLATLAWIDRRRDLAAAGRTDRDSTLAVRDRAMRECRSPDER